MGWGKKIGRWFKNPRPPRIVIGGGGGGGAGSGGQGGASTYLAVVEQDPNPEFPSAYCNAPMRLRNLASYAVAVRYTSSYRTEGPNCDPTPRVESRETTLGAQQAVHLGCSRYRTPNMTCLEIREWTIVATERAG
jgi:hypothetical protein